MKFRLPMIACLSAMFTCCPNLCAQETEQSSKQEAEAISQIKAAGGSVVQISSADSTREVSYYLAGKTIKDEHLKPVSAVGDVIWLNIANTGITNAGLKSIADLNLKKLHLEKTGIGDEGLAYLKEMKDLEYLNLYATSVTDAGLKHLENLKNLKRLYVWQSKVTDEGMKALEAKIPGLKVVGQCKLPVVVPPKKEDTKKEMKVKEEKKKADPPKEEPSSDKAENGDKKSEKAKDAEVNPPKEAAAQKEKSSTGADK